MLKLAFTLSVLSVCVSVAAAAGWSPDLPAPTVTGPACCSENAASHSLFQGPAAAKLPTEQWRQKLASWREDVIRSVGYDGTEAYENAATNWVPA